MDGHAPWAIHPGLVGFCVIATYSLGWDYAQTSHIPLLTSTCNIKGNISYNTGERIYHLPGQAYYEETRISTGNGERWFCSEEEARAAGWRKSRE